ncbi:MAG: hypothetical protein V4582_03345 [Pseudomonadota bacterium]
MEIEGPHQHHHGHGTGMRWLDISLALSAFVVSIVSLYLGIHSAHTMEKLVASNSYPNIEVQRSNIDLSRPDDGLNGTIDVQLHNTGVGPARIEWVSLSYKERAMGDIEDLLSACCGKSHTYHMHFSGNLSGSLVPAGSSLRVLTWAQEKDNPAWTSLHEHMDEIAVSACYCSVFDECYVMRPSLQRPQRTETCEAPPLAFYSGILKRAAKAPR